MHSLSPKSIDTHILPSRVLDLALMRTLDDLNAAMGTGHVVLVKVDSALDPLALELASVYGVGLEAAAPNVLEFHTQLAPAEDSQLQRAQLRISERASASESDEAAAVRRFILSGCCFAAPLAKRGVGTMTENVTVGRARNKDLVLRAPGISKLHAWFQIGPEGVEVCDAGSKNGTTVGGVRIEAREPVPVVLGEAMRFATIEIVVCSTAAFWEVLRGRVSAV